MRCFTDDGTCAVHFKLLNAVKFQATFFHQINLVCVHTLLILTVVSRDASQNIVDFIKEIHFYKQL